MATGREYQHTKALATKIFGKDFAAMEIAVKILEVAAIGDKKLSLIRYAINESKKERIANKDFFDAQIKAIFRADYVTVHEY